MLEPIAKIENPVARSAASAVMVFSAVTIIAGGIIGFSTPKDESANGNRLGVYASLVGAGCGALLGLAYKLKKSEDQSTQRSSRISAESYSKADSQGWNDWRNFVVVGKVKESAEITSFYLKPQDGGEIHNFKPGQFLTIKLNIPGQNRPTIRTYSLSDYTDPCEYYRLSIKRELAPKDLDVPPGLASNFMHDHIQQGSVVPAKPPNGKFFLDVPKSLPAVLISNGVGITPMISMAKAASHLKPNRHIWFLHGARSGEFHAFRDEVMAIAQQNPNLHVHYRYSRPRSEDEGKYHSNGYVDINLIQESVIPEIESIYGSNEAEYFLCGSPAFMQSLLDGLKAKGIPDSHVFFESFSKGVKGTSEPKSSAEQTNGSIEHAEVVFAQSGKTLAWKPDDGTLLEFAEANGLNPPYSCRAGICLTCMCKIDEGEVEYEEPPTGTPDEGSVLICISKPKTAKVVLDL